MNADELPDLAATQQAAGIRRGDWSAVEVMRAVLGRVEAKNPAINAYCTLNPRALDDAAEADRRRSRGESGGPLDGVPFSVKDLIPTAGLRTTLGSLAHRDWIPDHDEISVARMRGAGAVLIGKTNTRELGYGVVTDNELFGATRNPWDLRMTAGGSSGGAAAAIASGMGSIALGTDGGGSLRVPAALCGVFALKPTFGVVPMYPVGRRPLRVGLDSWGSLECIGPLSRTVADAALVMSVIAGFEIRDRYSMPMNPAVFRMMNPSEVTVAYSPDLGIAEVDPEIAEMTRSALEDVSKANGWTMRTESPVLPPLAELRSTFSATVAMDSDLVALRELAERVVVSQDIRELVDRSWKSNEFVHARIARQRLYDTFRKFGQRNELLMTPTTATVAFPLGQRWPDDHASGIADGSSWSPFAFLANLTGQPAASVPISRTRSGLPVGLQVIGPRCADDRVLAVAQAIEQATAR